MPLDVAGGKGRVKGVLLAATVARRPEYTSGQDDAPPRADDRTSVRPATVWTA